MVTGLVFQKYLLAMKRKVILIALCVVVVFLYTVPRIIILRYLTLLN